MFVITGNTFNTGGNWMGGEAIIRLQAGPIFSGQPTDYWAPTNWLSLDNSDTDLGGVSAMLIDVPGAKPSQLGACAGKRWQCLFAESEQSWWHHGACRSAKR